jgi:drug/metabolite transporter (DMT)-like permease
MALGKTLDELAHARAKLVREVRSRRPDEPVDVLAGRLRHAESLLAEASLAMRPEGRAGLARAPVGTFRTMRRPELADLMLLATVTLWGLNFTVTKYVLSHGFQPLAYGCLRFGAAAAILGGIAYGRERTLAVRRRDFVFLGVSALIGITLNQVTFVYGTKLTTATSVALMFGTLPVMAGLFAFALGIERLSSRFWLAAALAIGGAVLVALGSGGGVSGHVWGDLLALAATLTWAWYSVAAAPVLSRYSALRVSGLAFVIGTIPLLAIGSEQLATQDYGFSASIWLLYVFAVLGPLVVANLLWFGAISRVGPSHAAVFANLQPFLGAIFALLILSEPIGRLEIAGGLAIAGAIILSRDRRPAVPAPAAEARPAGTVRK